MTEETRLTAEKIKIQAKQLHLPMFTHYEEVVRQMKPSTNFGELLSLLMQKELEQRQENKNRRRLKQGNFPFTKTLEELDMSRYEGHITDLFLQKLSSCQYIDEKKNIIMIGNPGRGKTHMAIGLGLKACAAGMSVLFKNAADLSTELEEAKEQYILGKLEKKIQKADLLIIDEMGYISFNRFQSELLFKVMADRSERKSTIVTTNLPFSEWVNLFENKALVSAMVDRLTFRSHILDMNGDSYRLSQAIRENGGGGKLSSER